MVGLKKRIGAIIMIQRRYELSNEQHEPIKDLFPSYRTGRRSTFFTYCSQCDPLDRPQ